MLCQALQLWMISQCTHTFYSLCKNALHPSNEDWFFARFFLPLPFFTSSKGILFQSFSNNCYRSCASWLEVDTSSRPKIGPRPFHQTPRLGCVARVFMFFSVQHSCPSSERVKNEQNCPFHLQLPWETPEGFCFDAFDNFIHSGVSSADKVVKLAEAQLLGCCSREFLCLILSFDQLVAFIMADSFQRVSLCHPPSKRLFGCCWPSVAATWAASTTECGSFWTCRTYPDKNARPVHLSWLTCWANLW